MIKFKILFTLLLFIIFLNSFFSEETSSKTIKREPPLKHSAIIFIASLPLTLTYSLLSYRFYKMYEHSDVNYSLSKTETKNVFYFGISSSFIYAVIDYFNYKKKLNNGNHSRKKRKKN